MRWNHPIINRRNRIVLPSLAKSDAGKVSRIAITGTIGVTVVGRGPMPLPAPRAGKRMLAFVQ
jgi:hypothetical protein